MTVAVGTFTLTSADAPGPITVTAPGMTGDPDGVILLSGVDDGGAAGRSAHCGFSVGSIITTGAPEWSMHWNAEDAVPDSDVIRASHTNQSVDQRDPGVSGQRARYNWQAWVSGGVSLNVVQAADVPTELIAIFFQDVDWQLAESDDDPTLQNFSASDAGTVTPVTGFSGAANDNQIIFLATHHAVGSGNVNNSGGAYSFGIAVRRGGTTDIEQICISRGEENGAPSCNVGMSIHTDRIAAFHDNASPGTINAEYEVTNIGDADFTITTRGTSGNTGQFFWTAIELDTQVAWCGASDPPITATTKKTTTTGVAPEAAGVFMTLLQTVGAASTDDDASAWCVGAFDDQVEASICCTEDPGAGDMVCNTVCDDAQAVNLDGHQGGAVADFFDAVLNGGAFDSDGFTLSYSAANGTQRRGAAFAIGEAAAAGVDVSFTVNPDFEIAKAVTWNTSGSVALAGEHTIAHAVAAELAGSLALGADFAIAKAAQWDALGNFSLSTDFALTTSGISGVPVSFSVDPQFTIAKQVQWDALGSMSLALESTLDSGAIATFNGSVLAAFDISLEQAVTLDAQLALVLAGQYGIEPSASAEHIVQIAIAHDHGLSTNVDVGTVLSFQVNPNFALAAGVLTELAGSFSLDVDIGIAENVIAELLASFPLDATIGTSMTAVQQADVGFSIEWTATLTTSGVVVTGVELDPEAKHTLAIVDNKTITFVTPKRTVKKLN